MMKTIAILLFSAFALTGCATDEGDQVNPLPIDKPGQELKQVEVISPAVKAWAEQFASTPRGPQGTLGDWAEEIVIDNLLYTLLHGKNADALLDALGNTVVTIPCHACDRQW